jgi:hypothetical protein
LLADGDRVIIHRQVYLGFFMLSEHTEPMPSREGKARRKALLKARRLLHDSPAYDAESDRT